MSHIIKHKTSTKSPLSPAQKTFNRLKKKVALLQEEIQKVQKRLDEALAFYYGYFVSDRKEFLNVCTEFIKILYQFYKNKPKALTKKERAMLKEVILDKITDILESITFNEVDPEIRTIFKEMEGMDYEKMASNQLNSFKQEMEHLFEDHGLEVDLSKIDLADDEEKIKYKILEAMKDAAEIAMEKEEPRLKPKSKREIQKEMKAQELENLRKNGLGSIYKQLAKVFHPDLEQDPEQRVEKEKLMKRLTNAYENDDLHTLLSLEMEWMNRSNQNKNMKSDDQLKIYNSILKDQIDALQQNLQIILFDIRYMPIHPWAEEVASSGCIVLQMEHRKLQRDIHEFQHLIRNLKGRGGEEILKSILQEYLEMKKFFN